MCNSPRVKSYGNEVHSDIWGPSPVKTLGGKSYYITFTDDHSRETYLDLWSHKSDVFNSYKAYEARLKMKNGVSIKILQSNRGGEYLTNAFSKHLAQAGTISHLTIHDSPEQNGVAECLNWTLLKWTCAMLHTSGLPKYLWGECIKHAAWIKNCTFTCTLNGKMPYEAVLHSKPNLNGLPEWGSQVWVHNASNSKLDVRAVTGHWMGYDTEIKDSCVYWPERRKVSVEHNICFDPEFIVI